MFEIAGGIVLAVIIICLLPHLIRLAVVILMYGLIIGVCMIPTYIAIANDSAIVGQVALVNFIAALWVSVRVAKSD